MGQYMSGNYLQCDHSSAYGSDDEESVPNISSPFSIETATSFAISTATPEDAEVTEEELPEDIWSFSVWLFDKAVRQRLYGQAAVAIVSAFSLAALQFLIAGSFIKKFTQADHNLWVKLHGFFVDIYDHLTEAGFKQLPPSDTEGMCGRFEARYDSRKPIPTVEYDKQSGWNVWSLTSSDRSLLDEQIFLMASDSRFHYLFIGLFICVMAQGFTELYSTYTFHAMIWRGLIAQPQGRLNFVMVAGKWWSIFISLARIVVVIVTMWAACDMFLQTPDQMELIANSLTLAFIFTLGNILYIAVVPNYQKASIKQIKVEYHQSAVGCQCLGLPLKLKALLVIVGSLTGAVLLRRLQVLRAKRLFWVISTVCLFFGPDPDSSRAWHATFPVVGLCESLQHQVCSVPMSWQADDCLSNSYGPTHPCYAFPNSSDPACKPEARPEELNPIGDSEGLTILFTICTKMLQKSKVIVRPFQDNATSSQALEEFPRIRDIDDTLKMFAAPYACPVESAHPILERQLEVMEYNRKVSESVMTHFFWDTLHLFGVAWPNDLSQYDTCREPISVG